MGQARAGFGKQCRRKYVIVVETGAVGRCCSGSFKATAGGSAQEGAEQRCLECGRSLVAEPAAQVIFLSDREVQLNVIANGVFTERQVRREVIGRCAGDVLCRGKIRCGISGELVDVLQDSQAHLAG